ncbi:hypothetical protein LYNGBM3L_47850 [Moorena producens 3L]|uniref:Uncharacterized protein n=1 Tax=Moorena producens 3L TaxID=489825 RepID=F4XXP4_9CYAN|nr:hypothetical protein LYNGBM3L_47850 [Moorena producens 3L]
MKLMIFLMFFLKLPIQGYHKGKVKTSCQSNSKAPGQAKINKLLILNY